MKRKYYNIEIQKEELLKQNLNEKDLVDLVEYNKNKYNYGNTIYVKLKKKYKEIKINDIDFELSEIEEEIENLSLNENKKIKK